MNNTDITVEAHSPSLQDYVPPTNILVGDGIIDLNALSFQIQIPEKYLSLLAGMREPQSLRAFFQRANERDNQMDAFTQLLTINQQREIDSHVVTLRLNGMDVDIEQGELREIMEDRLEKIRDRKKQLVRDGASADKIEAMDDLIDDYKLRIKDLREGKTDADTMKGIEDLIEKDPILGRMISKTGDHVANDVTSTQRKGTSFSSEEFGEDTIQGASLTQAFHKESSPEVPQSPAPDTPVAKPEQRLDSTLESMGF